MCCGHSITALMQADNGCYAGLVGRFRMPLLDDDRALHVGVELAEVIERPGRVEGLRERCAWGDGARLQHCAILTGGGVRNGVVIRPGDAAADRNGNLGWVEGKVLNLDGKGFSGHVTSCIGRARRGLLSRFRTSATGARGLGEIDGYPGLVPIRAEPGDTGVSGI